MVIDKERDQQIQNWSERTETTITANAAADTDTVRSEISASAGREMQELRWDDPGNNGKPGDSANSSASDSKLNMPSTIPATSSESTVSTLGLVLHASDRSLSVQSCHSGVSARSHSSPNVSPADSRSACTSALLAPKRPPLLHHHHPAVSTSLNASQAFKALRRNKSDRWLQVDEGSIHQRQNIGCNSNPNQYDRQEKQLRGVPSIPSNQVMMTNNLDKESRNTGFHPHDSFSSLQLDPTFLDMSLGEQSQQQDHDTTSALERHSISSTGSSNSQRQHATNSDRPKFVPPPPRTCEYQIAKEAALVAAAAAQTKTRKGWGTFARNMGFLYSSITSFVEVRSSTFTRNVAIIGELLSNQRELNGTGERQDNKEEEDEGQDENSNTHLGPGGKLKS